MREEAKPASKKAATKSTKKATRKTATRKATASKATTKSATTKSATAKTATRKGATRKARTATKPVRPSNDQIRDRAYFIFLERGGSHGCHMQDWLQAEQELINS